MSLANLYPAVLHFPLSILPIAVALNLASLHRPRRWSDRAAAALYAFGTPGAVAAYLAGRDAEDAPGRIAPAASVLVAEPTRVAGRRYNANVEKGTPPRPRTGLALLLPAILAAALAACSVKGDVCWVCQREITPRVRVTLSLENGRRVHACCPRCAMHYETDSGRGVRSIEVSDYASNRTLLLKDAFLVEGSDEAPCLRHHHPVTSEGGTPMQVCYDRCMPSLIAFGSREAAAVFQEEHGGTLIPPGGLAGRAPADR